ncbi:3-hydroxyacyl-CoA dehydrogenase/enoyl-CoA hydratase family protein [Staphylococcus simulans]|uniref:3-hydroxyacyl-CoA dehydrogenase/crotonase FadB n=1 Tax=Staphylococcus simulans TaxID=1286 RepID=UPI000D03D529|nr:3-hydroxyacyl-CoA dehydrogenase/enoyl-CoA hydratase family protein [Staphylococcus simulans]MCE5024338.1 3-hydroxyacyl-CoA dehydrogenase/enoyl-CoA hydratase family protein [Staphylococcus simulans]MEB6837443.1 3-hydroxyacyl-CoA dehydrogenase/enoyl-CoA hydratase family protein [Staphylococcus simulans]PTI97622.1 3-hydroxyacyl-CoA dehydrogenase [Staphylococcus simulans]PTJ00647.1 3-hydroxyacyl-CoA dehydrogenase [Staphylococcus simulans]PTJ27225.1 3-hydroxyacyl-CoA dehydrogenase [Staphylococcu
MTIRKVTVLGAGTMGAQLAAMLVNAGLKVKLLDIVIDENDPNKISRKAYETITDKKRPLLFNLESAGHLTYGNFHDDLEHDDADLYLEAVKEDLAIKHQVWQAVTEYAKNDALFATNTSGIPINAIAQTFNAEDKARFFGLHFFNPPRIMKLVEVIPSKTTRKQAIEEVSAFAQDVLGKGVVIANDVPGFVANRVGTHSMNDVMYRAEQQGFSIPEVDALTGKVIGRPKTGTYALTDLVGLDIAVSVINGLQQVPEEASYFKEAKLPQKLYEAGALGRKTKQGFYKKDTEKKQRLVFDPESGDYLPVEPPKLPILAEFNKDLKHNLDVIFETDDPAGQFLWETLRNNFYYAAQNVPKATKDFRDIDRALVWGFNWKLGPFQLWDLMGFNRVKTRMKDELGDLPDWIDDITDHFYQEGESIENVTPVSEFVDSEIWNHQDSKLSIANSNQLLLKLQSKNNVISNDFNDDLAEAIDLLEQEDYSSMVIYADGNNFSVGANLYQMKQAYEEDRIDKEISEAIEKLHYTFNRLKYSLKPIVTAVHGRALGGGCELVLYSPFVVAASETYIGLVEAGVGLLPSGGGLAEMADRILSTSHKTDDKQTSMSKVLMNIGFAKVSTNAYEAIRLGYLRETDTVIFNKEKRVEIALKRAQYEAETNYIPTPKRQYIALGEDFKANAEGQLDAQVKGHFISPHDYNIALRIATVLAGGDLPRNTFVNQRYIQTLEKANFIELLKTEKTYERISHMLETGKPLRN